MIPPPQEFHRMVASSGDDDTIRIDFVDEESAAYIEAFRQVVFEIDSEIKHLNSRSKQTGIAANNVSEMKEQQSGFEAKNENIKTIAKLVADKINSFGTVCDPLQLRITRMYQDMTQLDQTLDVYKSQVMLLDGEVRKEEDGNVTFQPNADLNESGNEESHQEIEPVLQEYIRKTVHDTMKESEQQMNQRWGDQNKMMSDQNKAVTDRMKKIEARPIQITLK